MSEPARIKGKAMSAKKELGRILLECSAKAQNAAMRGKPIQWSYWITMFRGLDRWFTATTEGGLCGQALALCQSAERRTGQRHDRAAKWWAFGVYARRILRASGVKIEGPLKPDLSWLRKRAREATR